MLLLVRTEVIMDSGVKDIFELEKEPANSRGASSIMKDAIIGGIKAI